MDRWGCESWGCESVFVGLYVTGCGCVQEERGMRERQLFMSVLVYMCLGQVWYGKEFVFRYVET